MEEKKLIEKNGKNGLRHNMQRNNNTQNTNIMSSNKSDVNFKSELIDNIINNQNISVQLCDEEFDELDLGENRSIEE